MADTPNEAPAAAPAAESVATPNTNSTPAEAEAQAAPDMHGFTSEDLAGMRTFIDNNGGWEKIKSKISNPAPAPADEQKPVEPVQPAQPEKPADTQTTEFKAPPNATSMREYAVRRYFWDLAETEKYSGIAKELKNGGILKEMTDLGIHAVYPDGSIDEDVLGKFLDLKAQTVPAKQTSSTPEASAAPTVDYVPVGDKITDMNQALQVIRQDSQLRSRGLAGHPSAKLAEDFLRENLNKNKK